MFARKELISKLSQCPLRAVFRPTRCSFQCLLRRNQTLRFGSPEAELCVKETLIGVVDGFLL
jgi:hypothetical protein